MKGNKIDKIKKRKEKNKRKGKNGKMVKHGKHANIYIFSLYGISIVLQSREKGKGALFGPCIANCQQKLITISLLQFS